MDPKNIRIIFLGTPGFAACSLEKLILDKYNIVAVVTAPDKPAGRGRQLQESEVKQMAVMHGIRVLQPEKLKSPEFIEELMQLKPDLMIVVAFRMLPEAVWSLPPMGTFNLHGSLLPQYRGAAPINRAIMNGETKTGVTTFLLKHEIDTGNILFRVEIPIGENETAGELHDRMMVIGATLVAKTVDAIASGNLQPKDQQSFVGPGEILKDAPKIFKETCKIDWTKSGREIFNHVRGLSPFPAAWSDLINGNEERIPVKIFFCRFTEGKPHGNPGVIDFGSAQPGELCVNAIDGIICIDEIQAPGKKRMRTSDFLRGFKINPGARFE